MNDNNSIDLSIKLCQAIAENNIKTVKQCLEKEKTDPNHNSAQSFQYLSEQQQQEIITLQGQLGDPFDRLTIPVLFLPINIAIQNIINQQSVNNDYYSRRDQQRRRKSLDILNCLMDAGVQVDLCGVDLDAVTNEAKLPTSMDFIFYSLAKSEQNKKFGLDIRRALHKVIVLINNKISNKMEDNEEKTNKYVSVESAQIIVQFLETGKIDFANLGGEKNKNDQQEDSSAARDKKYNVDAILSLYSVAQEVHVESLVKVCESKLAQILDVSNLCRVLKTAAACDSENLKKVCFVFMKENAAIMFGDRAMNVFAMEHEDENCGQNFVHSLRHLEKINGWLCGVPAMPVLLRNVAGRTNRQ